jgi:putative redox protein
MTAHSETETPGAFRQRVTVNAHTLHADIAAADGGLDSAPGPHDYFDVSLATCKALTAAWYAKKHALALERVVVDVVRDDSRERQGTYVLRVKVSFTGALSDDDKRKLHEAVSRCPIHKLMTTTTVEIETAPLELLDLG